jgi:hypothetical protein
MSDTLFRRVYAILGIGLVLEFFGHAVWAIKGEDKFVALVTGSADNIGIAMGSSTGLDLVHTVGYLDLALSVVFAAIIVSFFTSWARFATSELAIVLLSWASIWGFLTALSRMTANGWGDVWDVVERGPNFFLPLALVTMTLAARRQYVTHKAEKTAGVRAHPTPA